MATITSAVGAAGNFQDGSAWIGGVAPTAADDAVLQATTTSMTIGAGSVCRSLTATAFTGTLTHTAGVTLTIGDGTAGAGNVALAFGAFTYTLGNAATSAISFISTSATVQTVNFNGKTTGNVTFNAASNGSWQYTSGHVMGATGTVNLTKGTLDINGQTCSWGFFTCHATNVWTLTLGSAAIALTGSGTTFYCIGSSGTITANTAVITTTGTLAQTDGKNMNGMSLVMNGSGNQQIQGGTWLNVTRTGTASKIDGFQPCRFYSLTVTGTITINGNSTINRILVSTDTTGTARTLTAANWSVTNADFQDITGAGAGSRDFSAQTDVGDCGGNSNITFPASVTQTATGTSSFTWSTHGWTTRVPLPQDDVVINNAFSASQTVTSDMPRLGRSIDFTGSTGTPTWTNSAVQSIYGSLTLISAMALSGTNVLTLAGRGSYAITSAGKTLTQGVTINAPTGTYTLQDALNTNGVFNQSIGAFDTNSFNMTISSISATSITGNARNLTLGTTTVYLTANGASNIWNVSGNASSTLSMASSTIEIVNTSASSRSFLGGGQTYGTFTYTVAGSTGELRVTGANSFAAINFSDVTNARSLLFTAATTTTIRNAHGFNVQGTSGKLMTIASITAATHTLSSTSQQSCDYLHLTNSIATGGGDWYAGVNSTDNGGNTGWIFEDAPVVASGFYKHGSEKRKHIIAQ